jgi:hypothetical protein
MLQRVLLFIALSVTLLSGAVYSSSEYPSVIYVSYTTTNKPYKYDSGNGKFLAVSNSDDTPFSEVKLSSPFQYFGDDYDQIFVTPNGAIQLSKVPPCGSVYCGDFNVSYFGNIAGLLTDLNPTQYDNAKITIYQTENITEISYSSVPEFNNPDKNFTSFIYDFKIALMHDHSVVIQYIDVENDAPKSSYISGLISTQRHNKYATFTNSQLEVGLTDWGTGIPGIYPLKSQVKDGNFFVACPLSESWGITPSSINLADSNYKFTLTTLSASCMNDIKIAIKLGSIYVPCVLVPSQFSSPTKFTCDYASSLSSFSEEPISAFVAVQYPDDTSKYTVVSNIAPITITTSLTKSTDYTSCNMNSNSNTTYGCTDCNLCSGNRDITCMNLECYSSADTGSSYDYLYTHKSCNNSCNDNFAYDLHNECCAYDEMDCFGECGGTAVNATSNHGDWAICCEKNKVDCAGVCEGESHVDSCNVCGGSGGCDTYFDVVIANSTSDSEVYVKYDVASLTYIEETFITVYNTNNTSVFMYFELCSDDIVCQESVPNITYPNGTFEIHPFSNMTFTIQSNIWKMLSSEVTTWTVKTLHLNYIRPSQFSEYLDHEIRFLPVTYHCSTITSRSLCINLPGCIHCLDYGGLRVLKEINSNERISSNDNFMDYHEIAGSRSEQEYLQELIYKNADKYQKDKLNHYDIDSYDEVQKRSLYASIVPEIAGFYTNELEYGKCEDGWINSDCDLFPYDSSNYLSPNFVMYCYPLFIFLGIVFSFLY